MQLKHKKMPINIISAFTGIYCAMGNALWQKGKYTYLRDIEPEKEFKAADYELKNAPIKDAEISEKKKDDRLDYTIVNNIIKETNNNYVPNNNGLDDFDDFYDE